MDGDDRRPADSAAPAGRAGQDPPPVSRRVYEEVKDQFRIHDSANVNMGKKAQNLMIVLALVTTLLVTVATAYDTDRLNWQLVGVPMTLVFGVGAILTLVLCTLINSPLSYRVRIMGGKLLCCDRLDEKVYKNLIKDEEGFYKSLIKEYEQSIAKLAKTNRYKEWMLAVAYGSFIASVIATILVVVSSIVQ